MVWHGELHKNFCPYTNFTTVMAMGNRIGKYDISTYYSYRKKLAEEKNIE